MALDGWRDAARDVEEREDVGVGVHLAERLEHLFSAPHPGEPVVCKGDPHQRWFSPS
jgi:hypothetical protein